MDALILSCGTGGGHNAAAEAIREELERRGDRAVLMNPYALRGERTVRRVDRAYVSLVQKAPKSFGAVYHLGAAYSRLPWRSPVYYINRKAARAMGQFLAQNSFDALIFTHLYPAEMATILRDQGTPLPRTVFVATDYTCSPFVEETHCDAYVIPHPDLVEEFAARGIPGEKLHPLGIPVRAAFRREMGRDEARAILGLDPEETYLLVSAGSMGAGVLEKAVDRLYQQWKGKARLIVICGTNQKVYNALGRKYGSQVILLHSTRRMDLYLRACDLYLTKPGGLSSTEAAVVGLPLVFLPPIPGCETRNARFFAQRGLCIPPSQAQRAPALADGVIQRQREVIIPDAAGRVCDLVYRLTRGEPALP